MVSLLSNEAHAAEDPKIFVSSAAEDQSCANELGRLLHRQGHGVYISGQGVDLDSLWKVRLVVVLISERSSRAYHQRDEIHLALQLHNAGQLQVVPVYLQGSPSEPRDWELGLHGFRSLDIDQLGLEETANHLGRLLVGESAEFGALQVQKGGLADRKTIGDLLHGAALRIDRTRQWDPLVRICRSKESALFLLHGPRKQNLDLFVARVFHYLGDESGHRQEVLVVPLRIEFSIPRSEYEWENHLRYSLGAGQGQAGTALQLLRNQACTQPVFLVLGKFPIARRKTEGDGGLSYLELEALGEFLGGPLPELIHRASKGRHPIRALIATHYETRTDSVVDDLDACAYLGCRANGLLYQKLPQIHPIEWEDIQEYLDLFRERPPRHVYHELEAAFSRLRRDRNLQFRDVLELLSRVLD